jgi:hypothetical protein
VKTQNEQLQRQLDYYQKWLLQKVILLEQDINTLNGKIKELEPAGMRPGTQLQLPSQQRFELNTARYKVNAAARDLYVYSQALKDVEKALPLFKKAYVIQHPASTSDVPVASPLSRSIVLLLALVSGILLFLVLVALIEYCFPFVRHRGEVQRLSGFALLADLPGISRLEQRHLLDLRMLRSSGLLDRLRLVCGLLGARALKEGQHSILLTSPSKKQHFASLFAMLLAYGGYRTLLIDVDFEQPGVHRQIRLRESANLATVQGRLLPFIFQTDSPCLFVLPAIPAVPLNTTTLIELLPELQGMFDVIVIESPPFNQAATHLLATKVKQTVLLVRKRKDNLKSLKATARVCQLLNLRVQSVFFT